MRLTTALASTALAAITLTGPAASAADAHPCVTRAEWRQLHEDVRLIRAERMLGVSGRVVLAERLPDGTRGLWVEFPRCRGGSVGAGFDNFDTGLSAGDPWYSFEPFVRVAEKTSWRQR